jgi:hypothetical protein
MGVASKEKCLLAPKKHLEMEQQIKNGTTSFVNGKVVLFVMSLQIIMMF